MADFAKANKKWKIAEESRTQRWSEKVIIGGLTISGLFAVLTVSFIFGFLVKMSWPAIQQVGIMEYLTGKRWMPSSPNPGYGALPMIFGTTMVSTASLLIAVPWGIGTALYLSEVAPNKIREIVKPALEILAGIPSVVFGFIALVVVAPKIANLFNLSNGITALTGAIMLGIMALPSIVSISEDSLNAVPKDYRDAALALGATKWQTMTRITLPAAKSGIIAAVMLGFGRAVGETMTVLMATGNSLAIPLKEKFGIQLPNFLTSIRTLTAGIAIDASDVPWGSLHYHSLFVLGAMLFMITFIVNLIADLVLNKGQRREI